MMKKLTNVLQLLLLVIGHFAFGQNDPLVPTSKKVKYDTVFVTNSVSTYLVFETDVELVDIGRTDQYISKIEGNTVFIRSSTCESAPSNFMIKYGDQFLYGTLQAMSKPPQSFYDYRPSESEVADKAREQFFIDKLKKEAEQKKLLLSVKEKVARLQSEKDEIKTVGVYQDGILLQVTCIRNDNSTSYIKIHAVNKTSVNYIIDTLNFNISLSGMKKDLFKEEITPIFIDQLGSIKPHSDIYIHVGLPLVSLKSKEMLSLKLREKGASRNIKINIPSEKILKALNY